MRRLLTFVSPLALLAATPALAADAAGDAPAYLEGVVVEGELIRTAAGKTDTAVVDTPQAISVVTSAQFLERGAQNLQETLRYTAGVVAEAYGNDGRNDDSFVRGVEAPIYLDGLRQTFGYYSPRTDIHMLEQVEVLKGPGGSLYGAGAVGGLINQTSKRPQFTRAGELSVSYGTHDRYEATADVTGPLDEAATLAVRLVGVLRQSGTQTDYVDDDRFLLAPSLTWAPDDRTTLTVLSRYQRDKSGTISTFAPIAASLGAAPGRRLPTSRFLSEPDWEKYDTETFAVSLLAEHRLNAAVTLRSNSRFLDGTVDYQAIYPDSYSNPTQPFIDPDRRVLNRYIWAIYPEIRTFATDNHLQAKFATGAIQHELLAGVDYQKYSEKSEYVSGLTSPIDAYAPVYGNYTVPDRLANPTDRLSQVGFYIQDQIRLDRVSVLLGVRRDRAKNEADGSPPQVDKATTYRAAVMIDLARGVTPYVSYAESFQPVVGATATGESFQPTRGRQWEVGVKWQVAPASLITLAAYEITERNRLTDDPANPFFSVQTGEAKLKGIEVEATARLAGVDLTGALTFAETEITESNNPGDIGRPLESAPERQASLFAARTFAVSDEVSIRLGAGVRYVGESFSGDVRTPSYTLGDAYAALGWREWLVSVNATNLTDERYYSTCLARGDCFLGVRRTVTATVRRRF
ncbi:MAG: TonB-dependent siderophore receptor [Phenylobacterium sp.]|uniref:TonB-dependent siderophore receptor n=1 Tax=Phenylobacterium sp. TaxID=1871053 RepID=UPI001A1D17A0|nr:TonB-dependent siderophore receptor [Phenylobacterium sp.]MBJ7413410.1 TonB-dependent siderophore receptor [Phenylobacterium sp.]